MRISWRIFCATYIVVFLTVAIVCFALVEKNNSYVWNKTKENVLTANETAGQLFLLLMDSASLKTPDILEIEKQIGEMTLQSNEDSFSICTMQETAGYHKGSFVNNLKEGQQGYDIFSTGNKSYLRVISFIEQEAESYYLQTMWDLSEVYEQRESMLDFYGVAVLIGALSSGIILFIISHFIAVPIKRLSKAVNEIAKGDYGERIAEKNKAGGVEVVELSRNFNIMAETISKKVAALNDEIERREQFLADFTHELKTPMTTIIGYADLIRSFELAKEECSQSANTIYREAKRLERLSMQLLELFVVEKDKADMQRIDMESFFEDLSLSLRFLSEKYQVDINLKTDSMIMEAEPSLLYSLFYNLADNACKASNAGQIVEISAVSNDDGCRIRVQDFGRGIEEEHIKNITEPFYMEDKSRSRSQGGAGLGLALCKKIIDLHGGTLDIKSTLGKGTIVVLVFPRVQNTKEEIEWVK